MGRIFFFHPPPPAESKMEANQRPFCKPLEILETHQTNYAASNNLNEI